MRDNRLVRFIVAVIAALSIGAVAHAADPAAEFRTGISAFKSGKYESALAAFSRAREAGLDTPSLHYNLGVTYYKLGRYAEAKREFERLERNPTMRALAHYNLGIVALKQGDKAEARRRFQQAYSESDDVKLKSLAELEMERLRAPPPQDGATATSASISLGYDDNVVLPDLLQPSRRGDMFAEGFLDLRMRVAGDGQNGTRLDVNGYLLRYQDEGDFDMNVLRAGLARYFPWREWQTEAGAQWEHSTLGGEDYLRRLNLYASGLRPLGADKDLRLRYRYSQIDSLSPAFDPLEGWRQEFVADGRWRFPRGRWRALYALELNDRDDFSGTTTFTSYSPTRNSIRLIGSVPVGTVWEVEGEAGYRNSRYNDPNRLATGEQITREDDRYQLGARAIRGLGPRWQASIEYIYTNNGSTIPAYDYTRNVYLIGISGLF